MNKFQYESQTNVQTNMQTYSHMVWRVYAYTNIQISAPAPEHRNHKHPNATIEWKNRYFHE